VPKLEGWAYYGLNKLDQAVAEWKSAAGDAPDKEVQVALDRALADKRKKKVIRK